ncbi:MAG: universal stress protein [Haloferacaceae archaeon]
MAHRPTRPYVVEARNRWGAGRIVALADDLDADFVVVGGRDRSTARQALFGSASQAVIRSVDAPVITVRGG